MNIIELMEVGKCKIVVKGNHNYYCVHCIGHRLAIMITLSTRASELQPALTIRVISPIVLQLWVSRRQ